MTRISRFFALLACSSLVVSLSSCGDGAAPGELTQGPAGQTIAEQDIGILEVDGLASEVVPAPTSITTFIGITTEPTPKPVWIESYADFQEKLPATSANTAPNRYLATAVALFFLNGGGAAYIVGISDASVASHVAVFSGAAPYLPTRDSQIFVTPDAVSLSVAEWGRLNRSLTSLLSAQAMLIIDPPAAARTLADVPDLRAALGTMDSAKSGAVYFPWLINSEGRAVPPSGAVAGIWVSNDSLSGVWSAPANMGVTGIVRPEIPIDDIQQTDLNVSLDGKSFNAIRSFPNRGLLVWGARTLDGGSNDFRYIAAQRMVLYLDASIKAAILSYIYEPNGNTTWKALEAVLTRFLVEVWNQGGLVGSSPTDALSVQCGMGSTIKELSCQVEVAINFPAEFISRVYTQEMAGY